MSGDLSQMAYGDGRAARYNRLPSESCPYDGSNLCLKHWWLAGWHDTDIASPKATKFVTKGITNRKAALYGGEMYYVGTCKRHGQTERYTTTGHCVLCRKEVYR